MTTWKWSALVAMAGLLAAAGTAGAQVPDLVFDPAAQPVGDLAEVMPDDILGMGIWTGQEAIHEAFTKADFRKFWEEPSMAALRKELIAAMDAQLATLKKRTGGEEQEYVAALFGGMWELCKVGFRRPGAIVMTCPADPKKMGESDLGPMGHVVFMIDLGKKPEDRQQFIDKVYKPIMTTWSAEAKIATIEHQGIKLHRMTLGGDDETSAKPTWGVVRGVFFFSMGEEAAKQIAEVAAGKKPALAANKSYAIVREKWGRGTPLTCSFADIERIGRLVDAVENGGKDDAPAGEAVRVLKAMGLDKARYGGSIRYVDNAVVANRYIFAPAKEGLLMPFTDKPLTEAEMSIIPADALAGVAVRGTPSKLYGYAMQRAKMAQPPDPDAPKGEAAVQAALTVGVGLALSIFGDSGGLIVYQNDARPLATLMREFYPLEMLFGGGDGGEKEPAKPADAQPPFDDESEFGQPIHLVFKWKVTDVAKAKAMGAMPPAAIGRALFEFQSELNALPLIRKHQWQDQVIEYMRDGQGKQVAWIYQGDYLVASNTITGVMKVLQAKPEAAAVASEPVRRYAAHQPKNPTLFAYANLPQGLKPALAALKEFIEKNKDKVDMPIKTPPNIDALAAATSPVVFMVAADDTGVLVSEIGSMSITGWGILGVPLMSGVPMMMFVGGGFEANEARQAPAASQPAGKKPADEDF